MAQKELDIFKNNDDKRVNDPQAGIDTTLKILFDDQKSSVSWKPVPTSGYPTYPVAIRWFNNFAVINKQTGKELKKSEGISYTVTLAKPPKGTRLFVFDKEADKIIEISDKNPDIGYTASDTKITFTLNFGDPPTGFYP